MFYVNLNNIIKMKFTELSLKGKLFFLAIICTVISIYFLVLILFLYLGINWCIYKVLALIHPIFAAIIIIIAYIMGIRNIVTILSFPGTCYFFRRSLEYSFNKTMAAEVLKSLTEFRNCIEAVMT